VNTPVVVVPAAGEHIPALLELLRALDCPHFTYVVPDEVDAGVRAGRYFVALVAGEVAGAISIDLAEQSCQIETLVSHRPGCGRVLVEFARAWAREHGARKLWCWSMTRYRARGFYEAVGFSECFLVARQWYGEDCWYFGMPLEPAGA